MTLDADDVARAFGDTWELLFAGVTDGWYQRDGGGIAAVSHAPVATLNGVWTERVKLDAAVIGGLLDQVEAHNVPYCLQLRTDSDPVVTAMATARGMTPHEPIPLMLLDNPSALRAAPDLTDSWYVSWPPTRPACTRGSWHSASKPPRRSSPSS